MCGIGGIMMFPKQRTDAELQYIRLLASNIAVENMSRGRDATGVVAFSNRTHSMMKLPLAASRFVGTDSYKTFINRAINRGTKNVLIHTRAGTKGSEENNLNNHPIESHRFIGVHNGIIYNDDELFSQHSMYRAAEVDSEVIFRLLDTQGDRLTSKSLVWVSEQLSGMFTTAFVPKKDKNRMFMIRNDNPVTMYYIESLNIIVFASMAYYVNSAVADANKVMGERIAVNITDCERMEPKRQTIYQFDTDADNALEQLKQIPLSFTENWGGYNSRSAVYGMGDDAYFFAGGAAEIAPSQTVKDSDSQIEDILTKLPEEDIARIELFLAQLESNCWSEGWSKGRESLGEEMKHKIEVSYESGYNAGHENGYDEGFKDCENIYTATLETQEQQLQIEIQV